MNKIVPCPQCNKEGESSEDDTELTCAFCGHCWIYSMESPEKPKLSDYLEGIPYADLLHDINALVCDEPPVSSEAIDWLVSHGLIVLCTQDNPGNFQYYEMTEMGSRIYHNILSHFQSILDAHYDSGQLKIPTRTKRNSKWDSLWEK